MGDVLLKRKRLLAWWSSQAGAVLAEASKHPSWWYSWRGAIVGDGCATVGGVTIDTGCRCSWCSSGRFRLGAKVSRGAVLAPDIAL